MTVDLTGKTAVVTGGSGVLGSAMCRGLARSGAKVAICLLYTSPSPRDRTRSRMPSSA